MSKILYNQTASPIFVTDTGVLVLASPGSYIIPATDYLIWAASSDIITHIGSGDIVVNDGSVNLNKSDGTDLIKGLFPRLFVYTQLTQLLTITLANTEYSLALPTGTKRFTIYNRDNRLVKLNYVTAFTTVYESIFPGVKHKEDFIGVGNITIYVQSPNASQVLEVTTWT